MLIEKYKFKIQDAESLASFLLPMLEFRPSKRIAAHESLSHPWLRESNSDCKMSDEEHRNYIEHHEINERRAPDLYYDEGGLSSSVPKDSHLILIVRRIEGLAENLIIRL